MEPERDVSPENVCRFLTDRTLVALNCPRRLGTERLAEIILKTGKEMGFSVSLYPDTGGDTVLTFEEMDIPDKDVICIAYLCHQTVSAFRIRKR